MQQVRKHVLKRKKQAYSWKTQPSVTYQVHSKHSEICIGPKFYEIFIETFNEFLAQFHDNMITICFSS